MRVVHVITGLMGGGAEHTLYRLLANGLASGAQHLVVSLGDEGIYGPRIRELGIQVQAVAMHGSLPAVSDALKLREIVHGAKPSILQGWMYHGNLAATVARSFVPGRPALLWNVRQSLYDLSAEKIWTRGVIRLGRFLSSKPDAIIYNSRCSRRQHEAFGFATARSGVIPNGFDVPLVEADWKAGVRERFGVPESARVVGHIARFHPMKDHALFLRAAVRIASRMDDVYFILAGRGVTLQNAMLSELLPVDIRDRFVFLGERRDVPDIMRSLDIFCQSSWSEAFPNVLGEAMAMGVPCVATDVGDSAHIVGKTGVIVPPRQENELTTALTVMLSKRGDELRALGKCAQERIEARFSIETAVNTYRKLYEEVCHADTRTKGQGT